MPGSEVGGNTNEGDEVVRDLVDRLKDSDGEQVANLIFCSCHSCK